MNVPYAGAADPAGGAALLEQDPGPKLVDVRTRAELEWVGRPPDAVFIEWNAWPGGARNPAFEQELLARVPDKARAGALPVPKRRPLAPRRARRPRSSATRRRFNVLEGFEGDKDASGHRGDRRRMEGRRAAVGAGADRRPPGGTPGPPERGARTRRASPRIPRFPTGAGHAQPHPRHARHGRRAARARLAVGARGAARRRQRGRGDDRRGGDDRRRLSAHELDRRRLRSGWCTCRGAAPRGIDACGAAAQAASLDWYRERGITGCDPVPRRRRREHGRRHDLGLGARARAAAASSAGTLPLSRLLADAIHYARDGIAVTRSQHVNTHDQAARARAAAGLRRDRSFPAATCPATGALFVQPRSARRCERLAARGLDDFYRGELARAIAADLAAAGSPVALADLEPHRAQWRTPLVLEHSLGTRLQHAAADPGRWSRC